MAKDQRYYEGIENAVFALMQILKRQPKEFRSGYSLNPGSILNAYRDGDLTFNQAVKALKKWKERKQ